MPVRSSSSSVLRWPNAGSVKSALRAWADTLARQQPKVRRIGYFGSYARGDWGVGSDLDVVIVVESSDQPFERRPVEWDTTELPVPTEVLVYTEEEWPVMQQDGRMGEVFRSEIRWVYLRDS